MNQKSWLLLGAALGTCSVFALANCSNSNNTPNGGNQVDSSLPGPVTKDGATTDAADAADANVCLGNGDASYTDAQVVEGMAFAVKCVHCHQDSPADAGILLTGRQTSLVDGSMVFPPNLTPNPDPDNGLGCWTDPQIANAILNGYDNQDSGLCPIMPKWGSVDGGLDATSAMSVVAFLRSLHPSAATTPESECPPDAGAD